MAQVIVETDEPDQPFFNPNRNWRLKDEILASHPPAEDSQDCNHNPLMCAVFTWLLLPPTTHMYNFLFPKQVEPTRLDFAAVEEAT